MKIKRLFENVLVYLLILTVAHLVEMMTKPWVMLPAALLTGFILVAEAIRGNKNT